MAGRIRVGLVGASMGRGWAAATHLPALAALADFELAAVSTTRMKSARATADHYGAAHAFDSAEHLAGLDALDLVVVSVRAPEHFPAVSAAIRGGKAVLCEWPLGRSVEEAATLLEMAREAGVPHFVGLQGRMSPPLRHAAALIGDGWLGEVLSVDLVSSNRAWGAEIPPSGAYLYDARNGATLPSIIGGHSLDMVAACVGQFDIVHGMTLNRYPRGRDTATGEIVEKTSPDQLLVHARLANGAPVSAHIQGGVHSKDAFALTVWGERGTLRLESASVPEIMPPTLCGTQECGGELVPIEVPDTLWSIPEAIRRGPAANVAELYQGITAAMRGARHNVPDFAQGLQLKAAVMGIPAMD
jgi:predicted dehydrogenase